MPNDLVLFSPIPLAPATAGNRIRTAVLHQQIRKLGWRTHLVYLDQEGDIDRHQFDSLRSSFDSVFIAPFRPRARRKLTKDHWYADDWYQEELSDLMRRVQAMFNPEIVLCNYCWHSKIFDSVSRESTKIIDTHDRMGDRHKLLDKLGLPRGFFYTSPEEEAKMLGRADIILAIQDGEADYFRSLVGRKVVTVGHIPSLGRKARAPRQSDILRVGFFGSGNHINLRTLQQFLASLKEVAQLDRVEVVLGGGVSNSVEYADGVRVVRMGLIDDPLEFYDKIDVAVNPIEDGTGLKIKTVEALAAGVPVIGTSCAFEGLPSRHELHALGSPDQVAAAISELAIDPRPLENLRASSTQCYAEYEGGVAESIASVFSPGVSAAITRRSARRRVCLVTHADFWTDRYGSHLRIRRMIKRLQEAFGLEIFVARAVSDSDRAHCLNRGIHAPIRGLNDVVLDGVETPMGFHSKLAGSQPDREVMQAFGAFVRQFKPDVCVFEYLRFAYLIDALPPWCLRILDTHDLLSTRTSGMPGGDRTPAAISFESEMKALSHFDFSIAIQRTELALMKRGGLGRRALYLPVEFSYEAPPLTEAVSAIGFIGGEMRSNVEGLQWFLDRIWPFCDNLGVKLLVAGQVCRHLNLEKARQVELLGYVERESDLFSQVQVFINPVLSGSGLKIKTVQAMSFGLPVVATPDGASGCEDLDGNGLCIARSSREFLDQTVRLVKDSKYRHEMALQAFGAAKGEFRDSLDGVDLRALIDLGAPAWNGRGKLEPIGRA